MNKELYQKLVDMYVGNELPSELEKEMEGAMLIDHELAVDVYSLRDTMDALSAEPQPEFTEETYQRILMRVYAAGAEIRPPAPTPSYLQYQLPIQG